MYEELRAAFAEHECPKHVGKRQVHDQLRPVSRLAAEIQKQVAEHRIMLDDALLAPHDHAYDGKVELMKQTFGAIQRDAEVFAAAATNLGQQFAQLERYVAEWKADVERVSNLKADTADLASAPPAGESVFALASAKDVA